MFAAIIGNGIDPNARNKRVCKPRAAVRKWSGTTAWPTIVPGTTWRKVEKQAITKHGIIKYILQSQLYLAQEPSSTVAFSLFQFSNMSHIICVTVLLVPRGVPVRWCSGKCSCTATILNLIFIRIRICVRIHCTGTLISLDYIAPKMTWIEESNLCIIFQCRTNWNVLVCSTWTFTVLIGWALTIHLITIEWMLVD